MCGDFGTLGVKELAKEYMAEFDRIRCGSAPSQLWYWDRDCWQWRWSLGWMWMWRWGQGAPSLRKSCQVTQNNCSPHITFCSPVSEQETSQRQGKCKSKSKDPKAGRHVDDICQQNSATTGFFGKQITPSYICRTNFTLGVSQKYQFEILLWLVQNWHSQAAATADCHF